MKKIILPLLVLLIITGCSKIDKNTKEYKDIVNNVLSYNNTSVNTASYGYKYYIPIGVNLVYDGQLNKKFKVKDTSFMLYVDIVSYYYRNTLNFDEYYSEYFEVYAPVNSYREQVEAVEHLKYMASRSEGTKD